MKSSIETGSKPEPTSSEQQLLRRAFDLCIQKTRGNIQQLAAKPKSGAWAVDGNYFAFKEGFFDIGNWTSSFFTGMALLAWQETEDEHFLKHVQSLAPFYRDKVSEFHRDTMHDLGFLYSLYSVALYKLTGDQSHRDTGLKAADVLAKRFNERGNFIRAWGRMDTIEHDNMAIIDCMMNLPLLYWATEESRNDSYRKIAIQHADTVLKNFIHPDDSVYHAYRFDLKTGQPLRGDTYGGWHVESHWARGTAWAIYGFALSHTYTRDSKYLDASLRVARKFIASLDDEIVPMWDFKLPPDAKKIRDASAASVALCGLQELLKYFPRDPQLTGAARRLLARLCSEDYLDFNESVAGVQKFGQVGDGHGMGMNAYTSWGDYFLMEALARELSQFTGYW